VLRNLKKKNLDSKPFFVPNELLKATNQPSKQKEGGREGLRGGEGLREALPCNPKLEWGES